jgi:succinate-acetate transporter protein
LGLAGFAMTTFVLSMINGNIVSGTDLPVVLGLALAYGGVAQLLAGMWEFRAGNTFGAVAFSSFGAFWISYFVLITFNVGSLVPAHAGHAVGLYLWAWAIFTFYMTLAALRTNGAVLLVFVLLTITFVLLAIGADSGNMTTGHWGGYVGLATAAAAWYASFAQVINSTFGKTVAPLFPLNK